jgi:hypothetical protein
LVEAILWCKPPTEALEAALKELTEACAYISPIAGAVATKASVKDIRYAGTVVSQRCRSELA